MSRRTGESTAVSVDVYVRPSQLAESLDEYVVELEELAAGGVVDHVDISCWPARVPTRSPATDAVTRFEECRAWATEHDVSIQPPFSVHTVSSEFTGEHRTYLSTPVFCMVVRVDDAIAGVYPHTAEEGHRSIADGIAALEAGSLVGEEALEERARSRRGTCPKCGGRVLNVQGLRSCHDCNWVDRDRSVVRTALASR